VNLAHRITTNEAARSQAGSARIVVLAELHVRAVYKEHCVYIWE